MRMATAVAIDTNALVQQMVKKVTTIATLPEVTTRIIQTVEDPKSSATKLHQIISHDPALVTRILKVVNSAFYGLPGQIGSIERAIVLLGLNAVKNIAVAASLGQLFRGVKLCEGFTAKDLWTHCVAVGVTARELARQLKLPIADEAFLAGMIHDIGIMVSLQTSPEQLKQVCERAKAGNLDFCQLEREVMGVDHQQLGMALAEMWKFPRPCQLVAGFHHQPAQLADSNRTLVTLVHIADVLCAQEGQGFNLTAVHQPIEEGSLQVVGLDPAAVERVKKSIPQLMEAAAMFG
jgi:putative nucleotidyltransferase with HDIG domain